MRSARRKSRTSAHFSRTSCKSLFINGIFKHDIKLRTSAHFSESTQIASFPTTLGEPL